MSQNFIDKPTYIQNPDSNAVPVTELKNFKMRPNGSYSYELDGKVYYYNNYGPWADTTPKDAGNPYFKMFEALSLPATFVKSITLDAVFVIGKVLIASKEDGKIGVTKVVLAEAATKSFTKGIENPFSKIAIGKIIENIINNTADAATELASILSKNEKRLHDKQVQEIESKKKQEEENFRNKHMFIQNQNPMYIRNQPPNRNITPTTPAFDAKLRSNPNNNRNKV